MPNVSEIEHIQKHIRAKEIVMAKARILVVDDEVYIVHILEFCLRMEDYEVLSAFDGAEALEMVRVSTPALIVMDIGMPKMGGLEVCRKLKADDTTKDIPVILLSDMRRGGDEQTVFEVGAEEVISKPFSPKRLVERIEAILQSAT